jgi:hypothetical protein
LAVTPDRLPPRVAVTAALAALAVIGIGFAQPTLDGDARSTTGVALDSEYLIFVIDTSGSMRQYAWDGVLTHLRETMSAYPSLRGVQVLSDQGEYLLDRRQGEWLPYTPALQAEIFDELSTWSAFSNSTPYEGILKAIETFYDPSQRISLYVYSDDFAQGSVEETLAAIGNINRVNDTGGRKVRINAVAFPVYYEVTGSLLTSANYAALMRELCQSNGGSFIALTWRLRRADER